MSEPSMKSGESIILTTHRVSYNGVLYNMILTTQRLILVDSGNTRSEPRTIPLVLLQSATAADGTSGEPALSLSLGGTAGAGQSGEMNLSFPQHPNEERRRERNEWIKKLKKHAASARRQNIFSKIGAAPGNVVRLFGAARLPDGEPSAGTLPGTAPPDPAAAPEKAGSPPAPSSRRLGHHTIFAVTLILIFIIGMAVGAFLYSRYVPTGTRDSCAPVIVPGATVRQAPAPTPVIIPREGTWVRVEYNGTFVGWVGNPGSLQNVGGSGEQIYPIRNNARYVQASFVKQDYSGKTLTVEVYSSGVMTYRRTVRSPMGEVAFLIDPRTAEQPGVTPAATKPGFSLG